MEQFKTFFVLHETEKASKYFDTVGSFEDYWSPGNDSRVCFEWNEWRKIIFSNVVRLILYDIVKSTLSSFSRPTTAGFWARTLAAPATTSTSSFTAVPAPTSAARRRPSSRAWRESRSEMINQCQGLLIVVSGSINCGRCLPKSACRWQH